MNPGSDSRSAVKKRRPAKGDLNGSEETEWIKLGKQLCRRRMKRVLRRHVWPDHGILAPRRSALVAARLRHPSYSRGLTKILPRIRVCRVLCIWKGGIYGSPSDGGAREWLYNRRNWASADIKEPGPWEGMEPAEAARAELGTLNVQPGCTTPRVAQDKG